jgi:prepilin-type N-terminal cleavage/methylation domain-containing protein
MGYPRHHRGTVLIRTSASGFSLIELIVVAAIILVVTAVVFTSNSNFSRTLLVTGAAYDIALSLRNAQTYGLGTRASSGISNAGYGIHFDKATPASYFMFNDSSPSTVGKVGVPGVCQPIPGSPQDPTRPDAYAGDCMYSAGSDAVVTSYALNNAMRISNICAYSTSWQCFGGGLTWFDIVFTRPNGTPVMTAYVTNSLVPATAGCITVSSVQGTSRYLAIHTNGQILAATSSCP